MWGISDLGDQREQRNMTADSLVRRRHETLGLIHTKRVKIQLVDKAKESLGDAAVQRR